MPIVEKGKSLLPPFASDLISQFGTLAVPWEEFFREVFVCLNPLGKEQSFQLLNNASNVDIQGMQFNGEVASYVLVEYFVQRFQVGSTSLVEGGTLRLSYNHKSNSWTLTELSGSGPNDAGISFAMSSGTPGQVQYTSSNISGDKQNFKITWRARTLAAKIARPNGGW